MKETISRITESLIRLSGDSQLTAVGISVLSFAANFFLPVVPVVLTCFGLSLIDLYYGLKVAKVQKAKLESRRTWNGTIKKMRDTFTIVVAARGIELFIINSIVESTFLVGGVSLIIALTELWSILENLNTLNPQGPWRALGKFMRKKGSDALSIDIETLLKDDNTKKSTSHTEAMGDPCDSGVTNDSNNCHV